MAYIKVDHSKFEKTASAVDTFVSQTKSKMQKADGEVRGLAGYWQGKDYNQLVTQWNKVSNKDATYTQMIKALEQYAKFLRFAGGKYKDAQSRAINRANNLPRY